MRGSWVTEGRIRLTVLGGYLGSGKTTWLRHQLHEGAFQGALVIVNEAAETPVDDALLSGSSRLEVLAGGCACCSGKADLVALLRKVCDERTAGASFDRIVLETSGLADPGPIIEAVRNDPILVRHIIVSEIIVAVDALHALAQLRAEPLGRRQVESADCLIITKIDAADMDDLASLQATLQMLNPGAARFGAVKGTETPLPDIGLAEPAILPELSGTPQVPIFPSRLVIDETTDWTAFSVWLSALLHARGHDVVRVKGVVQTPAGRLLVQTVRKIVQSPEILSDQPGREDNVIVVIGRGYKEEDLRKSLRFFAAPTQ